MIRRILFLSACLLIGLTTKAQDPIFSQFYASPLVLNPAFAGNTLAPRIAVNYRNQWPSLKAFTTYAVSYEQFIPQANSGIGLLVWADDQGDGLYKLNKFSANYAYRVRVNRDFNLKFGVEMGFRQLNLDWNNFIFRDQLDPITGSVDPAGNPNPTQEVAPDVLNKTIFDVGAGILAYGQRFYGGFSIKHLSTPNENLLDINNSLNEGLLMRMSLHGGAHFTLRPANNRRSEIFVSPNIMVIKQGDHGQINAGAYYSMGALFFGGWYRHAFGNPDAFIALAGFKYEFFRMGYSYDITVSELSGAPSGGAHEISIILNFDESSLVQQRRRAERWNDCFGLFR